MEKRPVVYKRRPKKGSCAVQLETSVVYDDPGRRVPSSQDVAESVTASESDRKSWIDGSLSNRGRRSSMSSGQEFNLSLMVHKWVGTFCTKKDENERNDATVNLRDQTNKKSSAVNRSKRVNPPSEFVKEKQALFLEIDAFELESEEESPAPKARQQDWLSAYLEKEVDCTFPQRFPSENVPEDKTEDFVGSLSAVLRTPRSASLRSGSPEVCELSIHSDGSSGNVLLDSAQDKNSTLECDFLSAGLRRLQIGADGALQNLDPLVEEEEEETIHEGRGNEDDVVKEREFFPHSGEILLETRTEDLLPIFEALLEECHQTRPVSLGEAISEFCDLSKILKLGEGTFGEAFKGGGCVFKIVPMDGELLVNGEAQKTFAEMYSEVLLTKTLNHLRGVDCQDSTKPRNFCTNFIETKVIRICQGRYDVELCLAWEEWDAIRASDNDHPMLFPEDQLYVVFVLADGGKDLETFVLSDFGEAKSLLLQVVLALGVAEEGCGFEHRDLHWGNIVLARDEQNKCGHYRLLDEDLEMKTCGLAVSIIDFTLSRIDTGKHVFFCNLSADPALFEGPASDVQSDTYRRMLHLTKGHWEGSYPRTNCHWIHYLADVLLNKKSYSCSSQDKRALRSFRKRVLLYESAREAVSDSFFSDLWMKTSK